MTELLQKTIDLFEKDDNIKLIILEGSQVSGKATDVLSDHDINVYGINFDKYIRSNGWINEIGKPLIYQKPDFFIDGERIYSRLIVFYNRERIDVSFWEMEFFDRIIETKKLPQSYRNGYEILLDKTGKSGLIPKPDKQDFIVKKPTKDEFLKLINDVWYESYAIAKYLRRGNLWFAKDVATGPIKEFMKQLLIWDICCKTGWSRQDIHLEGKNLDKFTNGKIIDKISQIYSGYSIGEAWKSLLSTIDLAMKLASNISNVLNYELPVKRFEDIKNFIIIIKELDSLEKWN